MTPNEPSPFRTDLTELTPAEISDKQSSADIAVSMCEELTAEQLYDIAAGLKQEIDDINVQIATAEDKRSGYKWKLGEVQRAIQLAQDKNPGAPQQTFWSLNAKIVVLRTAKQLQQFSSNL